MFSLTDIPSAESGDNETEEYDVDDTLQSEIFLTPTITIEEPSVDNIISVMYSEYSMTFPTESHFRPPDITVKTQSFIQSRTVHATETLRTSILETPSPIATYENLEPLSSHSTTSSHFTNIIMSSITSVNFSSAVINPTAIVEVPTLSTKEISENGDNITISPTPIVKKGLKSG